MAEDEPSVAQALRIALGHKGHSVHLAADGHQALEMFQPGKYDLVITDFKMPKMDGLELAERIKSQSPTTPIILLTAFFELVESMDGTASDVDVLLAKPCSIAVLQRAIQDLFNAT